MKRLVNSLDSSKISALHYAARYDHMDIVMLLVESGADLNIVDDDGLTPLHFCAFDDLRYLFLLHSASIYACENETFLKHIVQLSVLEKNPSGYGASLCLARAQRQRQQQTPSLYPPSFHP